MKIYALGIFLLSIMSSAGQAQLINFNECRPVVGNQERMKCLKTLSDGLGDSVGILFGVMGSDNARILNPKVRIYSLSGDELLPDIKIKNNIVHVQGLMGKVKVVVQASGQTYYGGSFQSDGNPVDAVIVTLKVVPPEIKMSSVEAPPIEEVVPVVSH